MRIAWGEDARTDLAQLLDYLNATAPEASALIVARIRQTEQTILTLPKAARYDAASDTFDRTVQRTRLILTYRIVGDVIQIIRLWHTSRDPETKL